MSKTSLEVIAEALGGTYTARGDAVAVFEALKKAGFDITRRTTDRISPANYPD